ncbi:MAG: hypothetical protein WC949_00905 [Candidatus Paceibacterota bacterium]|jgi:hypothetical protein
MNKKIVIGVIIILVIALLGCVFFMWRQGKEQGKEQEQKGAVAPKTYSETFEKPIDSSIDQQAHKAVYEKVAQVVDFPVLYPQGAINGYKLTSIQSRRDMAFETKGSFTATYEKDDSTIRVVEGVADIGFIDEYLDSVNFPNGKTSRIWRQGDILGIEIPNENDLYSYFLLGKKSSKEDLIQLAKSLASL